MKRLFWKIVSLQQTYEHFSIIAKRHKAMSEELYFINPEQAQAHFGLCVFWVEKCERIHGKLRELSGNLTRVLRAKYHGEGRT